MVCCSGCCGYIGVSILAPVQGASSAVAYFEGILGVSILAPVQGASWSLSSQAVWGSFNSRPCTRGIGFPATVFCLLGVSILAPVQGASAKIHNFFILYLCRMSKILLNIKTKSYQKSINIYPILNLTTFSARTFRTNDNDYSPRKFPIQYQNIITPSCSYVNSFPSVSIRGRQLLPRR